MQQNAKKNTKHLNDDDDFLIFYPPVTKALCTDRIQISL